jgi:hypothetical protein
MFFFHRFAFPNQGAIAQLVEQRTENPCVPGSIPGGTTKKTPCISSTGFLHLQAKSKSVRLKTMPGSSPVFHLFNPEMDDSSGSLACQFTVCGFIYISLDLPADLPRGILIGMNINISPFRLHQF